MEVLLFGDPLFSPVRCLGVNIHKGDRSVK
jgi:hypothetical protein